MRFADTARTAYRVALDVWRITASFCDILIQVVTFGWRLLVEWFGPNAATIAGKVNWIELYKVAQAVISGGGTTQVTQMLLTNAGVIFVDPATASLISMASAAMIGVVEFQRRKRQGQHPGPK